MEWGAYKMRIARVTYDWSVIVMYATLDDLQCKLTFPPDWGYSNL